ncbi:MAG: hypothetical protein AAF479_15635 [Pseudomonadota bacterium]
MTSLIHARQEEPIFGAVWFVHAPWAHPMWHSYRISLADLLGEHPAGPATIHREGVTHEVVVEAVSNDYPIDWNASALEQRVQPLRPINYGYQFTADSHDAAFQRIDEAAKAIEQGQLNPDTDARHTWNQLFADAHSLRVSDRVA